MPKMTPDEIDAFLAQPSRLMRLATVDEGGNPRVVPVWFLYRDACIWFTARERSAYALNLARDPRVGASIDEDAQLCRRFTVQGPAEVVFAAGDDDQWRDIYRTIAMRYITEADAAENYLYDMVDQRRSLWMLVLRCCKVTTWRNPVAGEDRSGIWACRYYAEGSKLASSRAGLGGPALGTGWYMETSP